MPHGSANFGVIKKRLGDVFHELARRRESKIEEGHLMPDHAGRGDDQSLHQEPRDAGREVDQLSMIP